MDFVKEFDDKLQDESLSDAELLSIARCFIKTLSEQNKNKTTIVIQDSDVGYFVYGILTVYEHSFKEVCEVLDKAKETIDCWQFDDLIECIELKGWKYEFNTNSCSYVI